MKWIVALGRNNKDSDPRAQALRLQANFLLLRHVRDWESKELDVPNPITVYTSYLNNLDYLDDLWPLPEEEALIIENILTMKDWEKLINRVPLVNRLNTLKSLRKDDKAEALKKEGKRAAIQQNVSSAFAPGVPLLKHSPVNVNWLLHNYQQAKAHSNASPIKILRGSLWHQFFDLYKLAKGELSSSAAMKTLSSLTGIPYTASLTSAELQNELGLILRLIQGH